MKCRKSCLSGAILSGSYKRGFLNRTDKFSDEIYPQLAISGFHFRIYVVQFDTASTPLVYCQDLSLNGTLLNNKLIGKHRTVLLTHGDKVSMCGTVNFAYYQSKLGDGTRSDLSYMSGLELGEYKISSRIIGCGSFGEVRMAVHIPTNRHVACKISKVVKRKNFEPGTEIEILKNLCHVYLS